MLPLLLLDEAQTASRGSKSPRRLSGGVAKLAYAAALEAASCPDCGFESRRPHSVLSGSGSQVRSPEAVLVGQTARNRRVAQPARRLKWGEFALPARPPPGVMLSDADAIIWLRHWQISAPAQLALPGARPPKG